MGRATRRIATALVGLTTAMGVGGCDLLTQRLTLRVDHYMEPCVDASSRLCLRVLDEDTSDAEAATLVEDIEGFALAWGNVHTLEVDVTFVGDEPIAYTLVRELEREDVSAHTRFVLPLSPRAVQRVDDYRFALIYDMVADCETIDVCLEVARALTHDKPFEVELGHRIAPGKAFTAHAVWMIAD